MPLTERPDQRLDMHNPSIDEDVARRGGCAEVHLPTGRTCTLEYGHHGSCEFTPRDLVAATLSARGVGPPS